MGGGPKPGKEAYEGDWEGDYQTMGTGRLNKTRGLEEQPGRPFFRPS